MNDKIETKIRYEVILDNAYPLNGINNKFTVNADELGKKGYKTEEQHLLAIRVWYDVMVASYEVGVGSKLTVNKMAESVALMDNLRGEFIDR